MKKILSCVAVLRINLQHATSSKELGADIITRGEGPETTHFSVIDSQGNAVSNTYTLTVYG